jgi:hypothetical protein
VAASIKLYLDEDALDRDLVNALRSRSIDVLTAHEAGLQTASDEEHLSYATSVGVQFLHSTEVILSAYIPNI